MFLNNFRKDRLIFLELFLLEKKNYWLKIYSIIQTFLTNYYKVISYGKNCLVIFDSVKVPFTVNCMNLY